MLDVLVASICVACIAAPALPVVHAQEDPLVETGATVDQRVLSTALISNPLNGTFDVDDDGTSTGSLQWDVYSTDEDGIKLVVSSGSDPALRDADAGIDIPDYRSRLSAWSVSGSNRAFGFTATGEHVLPRFERGSKWRGFDGARGIEVTRLADGPVAQTRTTVRVRSEMGRALPRRANPTATIRGTAVVHL